MTSKSVRLISLIKVPNKLIAVRCLMNIAICIITKHIKIEVRLGPLAILCAVHQTSNEHHPGYNYNLSAPQSQVPTIRASSSHHAYPDPVTNLPVRTYNNIFQSFSSDPSATRSRFLNVFILKSLFDSTTKQKIQNQVKTI